MFMGSYKFQPSIQFFMAGYELQSLMKFCGQLRVPITDVARGGGSYEFQSLMQFYAASYKFQSLMQFFRAS